MQEHQRYLNLNLPCLKGHFGTCSFGLEGPLIHIGQMKDPKSPFEHGRFKLRSLTIEWCQNVLYTADTYCMTTLSERNHCIADTYCMTTPSERNHCTADTYCMTALSERNHCRHLLYDCTLRKKSRHCRHLLYDCTLRKKSLHCRHLLYDYTLRKNHRMNVNDIHHRFWRKKNCGWILFYTLNAYDWLHEPREICSSRSM